MSTNMFEKYDNDINKKDYPVMEYFDSTKDAFQNISSVEEIYNIKGDRIALAVKKDQAFDLYFWLDSEEDDIETIINNSTICFDIKDHYNNVILEKTIDSSSYDDGCLTISVNSVEAATLNYDIYGIYLSLIYPGGNCVLFDKKDIILID